MFDYRLATTDRLDELRGFLFEHGTNPWNYLPVDGVDNEFKLIRALKASALAAHCDQQLIGFAIFYHPDALPDPFLKYANDRHAIYIAEAVVHREFNGRGIGSELLKQIIAIAPSYGAQTVLLDRHAENAASAGMMRKAGFKALATFLDRPRRNHGNCSTTVLGYDLI
jgi:ribosomal protein S18 acetylase RimI-like enzyme